jgi:hypothetical protein
MPNDDLEQVKKLAALLSTGDRSLLWAYLAELPDSGIRSIRSYGSRPDAPQVEDLLARSTQVNLNWTCISEGNEVIYCLEGIEIFHVTFQAENFTKVMFAKLEPTNSYLTLSNEQREASYAIWRQELELQGATVTNEHLEQIEAEVLRQIAQQFLRQSIERSAKTLGSNLQQATAMVLEKAIKAAMFSGSNELQEMLGRPEQKYSAKEIKDFIFQSDWARLKPFIGVTTGGARNVKVADLPKETRRALGKRYEELRDALRNMKQDAKTFASATDDWRRLVLNKYPILETHPDLLDQIDPYRVPRDAAASDKILDPWEIAIEIAARETIPNYEHVSADSLKKAANLPKKAKSPSRNQKIL